MPVLLTIAFDLPLAMGSLPVLGIDTGTELAPAISLAYEKSEDDVMRRKPRDSKRDRLASVKLLSYSYAQIGCIEFLVAWLGFMLVFKYHNVPSQDLVWSAAYWTSTSNPYRLSNGVILSAQEQVEILSQAQTLYWFLVVTCQVLHVLLVRTRRQSIFTHGIFTNVVTDYGIGVELCLIVIFIFVPVISSDVMTFSGKLPKSLWFLFLLGWGTLFLFIEGFKWAKRNGKGGWIINALGY